MIGEFVILGLSLTVGILFGAVVFVLTYEPASLLKKRFDSAKVKKNNPAFNISRYLQEIFTPLSRKNAQSGDYMAKSKKLLLQAGLPSGEEDVIKYDTKKLVTLSLVCVVCAVLLLISFDVNNLLISILVLYVFYKLPDMRLKRIIKTRQAEFVKYLPDAVDLLSVCVQAGLGLDASFQRVADEFELTSVVVSSEFNRLNKDILSGLNRESAYKNLILRNDNPDLQSFVALLIQTDKLGTSVTQSLGAFCDTMRTRKRQRIEELSQQASTKMTIPMVLFMLPAIFIIIMYPAVQKITSSLGTKPVPTQSEELQK